MYRNTDINNIRKFPKYDVSELRDLETQSNFLRLVIIYIDIFTMTSGRSI